MIDVIASVEFTHNRLPALIVAAPRRVRAAVAATVRDVERDAKLFCPVDTGLLRSSIHGRMLSDTEGVVGTSVEYAAPVEFGHVTEAGTYVPGQPFLAPALANSAEMFSQRLTDLLRSEGLL